MIARVVEFSGRNRFLVLFLTAVAAAGGWYGLTHIPLDALPDLSDPQVIVQAQWDRSPDILEDQVTYPIVASFLGAPRVKAVRSSTDYGNALIYIIFEEGTDPYWARSRTMEYLSAVLPRLPAGATARLGPDATALGWVYQYVLVDDSGQLDLAGLRSLQDWFLRFKLGALPGVAEVASLGGYVKQYQVQIDPAKLMANPHRLPIHAATTALRRSNSEAGGKTVEFSGAEYMVRGRGYLTSRADIENVFLGYGAFNKSVLVRDVAEVVVGGETRRGVSDFNGWGDAPGGIVIMRQGENALRVIERVREKLAQLQTSLPDGVRVLTTYDRSLLIQNAISTLKNTLIQEMIVVGLVIFLFLRHVPSALIPILTIPVAVLTAFLPMFFLGLSSNIMSLSGIAISIGVLVDGAVVEMENAHKKLGLWVQAGRPGDYAEVRLKALQEVAPAVFLSLLVVAVSFLPIFALLDQEGRLFKPLAWAKNLTMFTAALLAVTFDPAMRMCFTRMENFSFKSAWLSRLANILLVGRYRPESEDPLSRKMIGLYGPVVEYVLERPYKTIAASVLAFLFTIPVFFKLGTEFMPPLNEGTILYMPTTLPGISIGEAQRLLQIQDRLLKSFPEVASVHGKAGRAETATDPAPLSMVETVVTLKPREQWRRADLGWRSRPITYEELIAEMDKTLTLAGFPNIWTQPIRNRIDMLSTGLRTSVGIKVFGPDLDSIEKLSGQIESALREVTGTRNVTAERPGSGYFLDYSFRRRDLAKYGLSVDDVQDVIMTAIGGTNVTTVLEGRQRYPVNVRYAPDFREDLHRLKRANVLTPTGILLPLSTVADLRMVKGPSMIRSENGELVGYVHIDKIDSDAAGYVEKARRALAENIMLPPGCSLEFAGEFQNISRVKERLKIILPLTLILIILLLYWNTGSAAAAALVLTAVPFSAIGAVWLLYLLDYHLSVAVWVGIIALLGLDAETGIFMLLYIQLALKARSDSGTLRGESDLKKAIWEGAAGRIRPKVMTVACTALGLLPIFWASGPGADMMKRVAAPMAGGLASSFALELLVYPALFFLWKRRSLPAL